MNQEVEKYFIEYIQIKSHFRRNDFWYMKNKLNWNTIKRNVKKHQYNMIKEYSKWMKFKTFQKYLFVNFFFNEKFNVYSKKIDKTYVDKYYIYNDNVKYHYKNDIKVIKEELGNKINFDLLYNLYKRNKIYFFTIVLIYKKYKDKLKFKDEHDRLMLDKYIYLEKKIKESKRV